MSQFSSVLAFAFLAFTACAMESVDSISPDNAAPSPASSASATSPAPMTPPVALPSVQVAHQPGELAITADHPASHMVMAGQDACVPVAQYRMIVTGEPMLVDRFQVKMVGVNADTADYSAVGVMMNGHVLGTGTLATPALNGNTTVELSKPAVLPIGKGTFQLCAFVAQVVPRSVNNSPIGSGVPRSGHSPALGLADSITTGAWDASYDGMLNVHATGLLSHQVVRAARGAVAGNEMVIRQSQPMITVQSLSSTTLANIRQDLFKVQVGADAAGPIGLYAMQFRVTMSAGMQLCNFRVMNGTTKVNAHVVDSTNSSMATSVFPNLLTTCLTTSSPVEIWFDTEETISGSGNVYTVQADVSGVVSSSALDVQFLQTDVLIPYGELGCGGTGYSPHTKLGLLWSDMSERPHYGTACPSSQDWTGDFDVLGLAQTVHLAGY